MKILLTSLEVWSHTVLHSFFFVLAKYLRSTRSATQIGSLERLSQVSPSSPILFLFSLAEEVILNEDRTTEEERRYIMEARKRAMLKRKKLRTLGKSRED